MKEASGSEYFASLRTQSALDKAEVAVVLIDATEPLGEQDARIISMVVGAGRALCLAFNKWDLLDEERRYYLEKEIDRELHAFRGRHGSTCLLDRSTHGETRPRYRRGPRWLGNSDPDGRLNAFLGRLVAEHPHPVRGGKQPRILFATQAGSRPPTFVLFASGFLEAGYRRYIERRLREEFGFVGTPSTSTCGFARSAARSSRAAHRHEGKPNEGNQVRATPPCWGHGRGLRPSGPYDNSSDVLRPVEWWKSRATRSN